MNTLTEVKQARRFYKDRHHAYGWEVGIKHKLSNGEEFYSSSLGTTRQNAVGHCMAQLNQKIREGKAVQS